MVLAQLGLEDRSAPPERFERGGGILQVELEEPEVVEGDPHAGMVGAVRALDLFKGTARLDFAGSDTLIEITRSQLGEITGVSIQGVSFVKAPPTGR